ncbi:hypothetical protein BGZ74_002944 [Mortierella antarctica]|nr:hypothetical protein BGZ74_002944 [Mortierella antarctica]KAG0350289.1 hypothetical protein BG005_010183 [Podila minutissima]
MSNLMRVAPKTLPRVSMARIPIVAFANTSHPSAYSSSSWAESAKNAADKLEKSAKSMAKDAERKASPLSQYASDAIRMVESHSVLKQDKAPIRSLEDSDHSEARYGLKHH